MAMPLEARLRTVASGDRMTVEEFFQCEAGGRFWRPGPGDRDSFT